MARWAPCKRKDFIAKLMKLGFESPEPGGRHFYMRHGIFPLTLPSNTDYSVPPIKMLLNAIAMGIKKKISLEEWQKL